MDVLHTHIEVAPTKDVEMGVEQWKKVRACFRYADILAVRESIDDDGRVDLSKAFITLINHQSFPIFTPYDRLLADLGWTAAPNATTGGDPATSRRDDDAPTGFSLSPGI